MEFKYIPTECYFVPEIHKVKYIGSREGLQFFEMQSGRIFSLPKELVKDSVFMSSPSEVK